MKRFAPWLQILGIGVLLLSLQLLSVFAYTYGAYVTPASQTIRVGDPLVVTVHINPVYIPQYSNVNVTMNFTSSLASYISGQGVNGFTCTISPGTGSINANCNTSGTAGDQAVFQLTFKAIQTGTLQVWPTNFTAQGSGYVSGTNTQAEGGTYTINPAPQPGSTPPSSPPSSSKPSQSSPKSTKTTSSTPPPVTNETPTANDAGDLAIDNVKVTPGYDHVTLSWHTSKPASADVNYGANNSDLDKTQSIKTKQSNSSVNMAQLNPGQKYSYTISATDAQNKQASYDGTFETIGFPVQISVSRVDKKSIIGTEIFVNGVNKKVDNSGQALFNLPAGSFTISVTSGKAKQNFTINVGLKPIPTDGTNPDTQSFEFQINPVQPLSWLKVMGLALIVILLAGFSSGLVLVLRARSRRLAEPDIDETDRPVLIGEHAYIKKPDDEATEVAATVPKVHHSFPKARRAPEPHGLHPNDVAPVIERSEEQVSEAPPTTQQQVIDEAPIEQPKLSPKPAAKDEPKDMFEMAEERFEQDDRFKNMRRK